MPYRLPPVAECFFALAKKCIEARGEDKRWGYDSNLQNANLIRSCIITVALPRDWNRAVTLIGEFLPCRQGTSKYSRQQRTFYILLYKRRFFTPQPYVALRDAAFRMTVRSGTRRCAVFNHFQPFLSTGATHKTTLSF